MAKQGFISWSGDESRKIAEALKEFFSFALPNPTLFVASKDLQAGEVWFTEIAEKLDACDIGIIVVTPQNIAKPWLHFEAGAISKRVGRSAAIPLLCGVANGDLSGTPLAQLQALTVSEENMRKLTSRLNDLLELGVSEAHIDNTFPVWWEKYSEKIANPEVWKGTTIKKSNPTTADLSVQMAQVAAAIADLTDRVDRVTRTPASAIAGQGDLATINLADLIKRGYVINSPAPTAPVVLPGWITSSLALNEDRIVPLRAAASSPPPPPKMATGPNQPKRSPPPPPASPKK